MKRELDFEKKNFAGALEIVKTLGERGYEAFFVGGCVRDALLGVECDEIDIATSATPEQVQQAFSKTVAVGKSFGVVLVIKGDMKFEVATFRKESSYGDGRHPEHVDYTKSAQEDVRRRDFTINGMLYDPVSGELYDYVGGIGDLERRLVRTIGDPEERFGEDRLRMIRAVRFASCLDFELDGEALSAIRDKAAAISVVSGERIREELVKILTRRNPGNGLRLLSSSGLLEHFLPEVECMHGVRQPPQFHPEGDVFEHTCLIMDMLYGNTDGLYSEELAVAALLHDVGKPPTYSESDRIRFNGHDRVGARMSEGICRRLRFSKKQIKRISELILEHLKFKDVFNMRESTLKRFLSLPYFEEHMQMHLADCMASHGQTDAYDFIREKMEEYGREEIKPPPLLSGQDLIGLGYSPGPVFSEILGKVEELQLENRLVSKEEALDFVLKNYPK
ncbi:MAG: CCA tRNA nucleotidyltransferase [Candidatus Dadabacteria bacterium]|nr:CCA tRNA nucleotidyltransferase [Candidatus Dadabacteria bacterium]MDE0519813.1 CCA tRNA nucleotidyltransferase [Candidatus Dadabacteria bacterium]MDE0663028.1 CCA tRNA nucleotidyltransferase [Candidatus Dadabacteria bacterium]